MYRSNTNKIGIQFICWFYSQGICYDARSYVRKKFTSVMYVYGKYTLFNLSSKQLISNGKPLVLWPNVDLVMTGKVSFFNDAVNV